MVSRKKQSWIAMIFFILGVLVMVYAYIGQNSGTQWALLAIGLLMLVAAVRLRNKIRAS